MKYIAILFLMANVLGKVPTSAQGIPELSFEELNTMIQSDDQSEVKVINFWATWCKPCIKELPYFDSLQASFSENEVKVLLVSLDINVSAAEKYRARKDIQSDVVYLDEVDHNAWIDRISPDWSGAIPATLYITPSGDQYFHEGELTAEALFEKVNQLINSN